MGLAFISTICETVEMANDLINQLGGTGKVAAELGVSPSVVSNWKQRNVPWQWRPTLAALAEKDGIELPDDFLRPERAQ